MVVNEIHKWVKTCQSETGLYFYRTQSGMELDLLLEMESGYVGIEVKSRKTVVKKDWTTMNRIANKLNEEWKGGLVVYRGNRIFELDAGLNIWAVPSRRLFQV
jgi:predicted AAA+ superfamily ATPase